MFRGCCGDRMVQYLLAGAELSTALGTSQWARPGPTIQLGTLLNPGVDGERENVGEKLGHPAVTKAQVNTN